MDEENLPPLLREPTLTVHDMLDPDTEIPEDAGVPQPPLSPDGQWWVVYSGIATGVFTDW